MNSETVRAPRAAKPPVFADFAARDLQKRLTSFDDHLLRRWERIALGSLVEGTGQESRA